MQTITLEEVESNFAELLSSVESGQEFAIVRGEKLVARLVPFSDERKRSRPKVGEMISAPFDVPEAALTPLSPEELKSW